MYPQNAEISVEASDTNKQNIFADLGYSILGVSVSNIFLNLSGRLNNESFAQLTYEDIGDNLTRNGWFWEDGDRFLINQFGHPYQGSTYFASARINGFNFYESMLFVPFGSAMWELSEPKQSINDFITTTLGGIPLGEMLHRLFLEVDSHKSIGASIGAFLVSPMGGYNKIFNRQAREAGGGNIYGLSVRTGIEKSFVSFSGHQEQADSWNYPGGFINVNVEYGNPFIQQSKTPYEHFELYAGFSFNAESYRAAIISDGYLLSYNLARTETTETSTGLSLHFDFFNTTNDLIDNLGYGNIQFSSNAIGWTVKHKYAFSEKSYWEVKAHAAVVPWGNSMYNSNTTTDDYWVPLGNTRSTYGMGGNLKLSSTLFHNKAGKADITASGYYITAIKTSEKSSTGNVFFLHSSLSYEFPINENIGIGVKGTFWGLFGFYDSAEDVNRRLVSSSLFLRFAV